MNTRPVFSTLSLLAIGQVVGGCDQYTLYMSFQASDGWSMIGLWCGSITLPFEDEFELPFEPLVSSVFVAFTPLTFEGVRA